MKAGTERMMKAGIGMFEGARKQEGRRKQEWEWLTETGMRRIKDTERGQCGEDWKGSE